MAGTLRERRRHQLRREIAEQALVLAERSGWAAVTVADIAEAAGISRRAFFTHFATKDDAVVHGATDDLEFLERALVNRPPDRSFVDVLRESAPEWVDEMSSLSRTRRMRQAVEREHPEVQDKVRTARTHVLTALVAPYVAADLGVDQEEPLVAVLASAFAGMGAALDDLFATRGAEALEDVRAAVALFEAMMERAAQPRHGSDHL